jgi:hypothetical protein
MMRKNIDSRRKKIRQNGRTNRIINKMKMVGKEGKTRIFLFAQVLYPQDSENFHVCLPAMSDVYVYTTYTFIQEILSAL